MALVLLLTSSPLVSEAEEPEDEVQVRAKIGAEAEMDAFAEEFEALEAEAGRQMMEAAMEHEEEVRREKEAQMAAEAERRMAEAASFGEPGLEAGSAEAQTTQTQQARWTGWSILQAA